MKDKKNNNVMLMVAVAVLALVGVILYAKFGPGSKNKEVTVEVVDSIAPTFNKTALGMLSDPSKTVNYVPDIPLDNLNNPRPFGPLR